MNVEYALTPISLTAETALQVEIKLKSLKEGVK
jgi:hypothetical protein